MDTLRIDLTKLAGAVVASNKAGIKGVFIPIPTNHLYHSDKTNSVYLDLILNASTNSQYGDTHFLAQSLPKEVREANKANGIKTPILGNAKIGIVAQQTATNTEPGTPEAPKEETELPF